MSQESISSHPSHISNPKIQQMSSNHQLAFLKNLKIKKKQSEGHSSRRKQKENKSNSGLPFDIGLLKP